jgi:undecaprenyl-diphosphatase
MSLKKNAEKRENVSIPAADRGARSCLAGSLRAGVLTAAVTLLVFVWLAMQGFAGETNFFDESARRAAQSLASPRLTEAMVLVTKLGSRNFLWWLGLCLVPVFLLLRWKREVLLFLVTMAGQGLLEKTLKSYFERPRPPALVDYPIAEGFSFPSGHALVAFCFYGILACFVTARVAGRARRAAIWAAVAALVLLIGLSRVYIGIHHLSDVLAGYALGAFWIAAVALAEELMRRRGWVE